MNAITMTRVERREAVRLLGADVQMQGSILKSIFAAARRALNEGEMGDAGNLCAAGVEVAEAAARLGERIEVLSRFRTGEVEG